MVRIPVTLVAAARARLAVAGSVAPVLIGRC
jgi:hypothetical protein